MTQYFVTFIGGDKKEGRPTRTACDGSKVRQTRTQSGALAAKLDWVSANFLVDFAIGFREAGDRYVDVPDK